METLFEGPVHDGRIPFHDDLVVLLETLSDKHLVGERNTCAYGFLCLPFFTSTNFYLKRGHDIYSMQKPPNRNIA